MSIGGHGQAVFVARQPIFRADRSVWGYELLFRGAGEDDSARIVDDNAATLQVIADGVTIASADLKAGNRLLINFPETLLTDGAALALDPDLCVVEVLESVNPTPQVLESLEQLRAAGFTLALDDYAETPQLDPFFHHVDLVKVDVMQLGADPARLREIADRVRALGCRPLAEKVEDHDVFETCRAAGYELFQGYFFCRPVILPGRKISSSMTARVQLLERLGAADLDPDEVASIIMSDPSLSYRLMRTINSPGYGLRAKVDNVRRAISFLGLRRIAQWLRVVLLSDLSTTKEADELALLSVHRARFLETISELKPTDAAKNDHEAHFLLGLFSLLDSLLGVPMAEALQSVPLSDAVRDALERNEGRMGGLLQTARCYEHGDWGRCSLLLEDIGVSSDEADRLYLEALQWAALTLGRTETEEPDA